MGKKIIKFPLLMKGGIEVRTLEELKENFDIKSIMGYYSDGRLKNWLEHRYYRDEVEKLGNLKDTPAGDISRAICEIFQVEIDEGIEIDAEDFIMKNEKKRQVEQYTEEQNILENLDLVAMSQDELEKILSRDQDQKSKTVYLCGEGFEVRDNINNVRYVGVNRPKVKLIADKKFDAKVKNITFENVKLWSDKPLMLNINKRLLRGSDVDNQKITFSKEFNNLASIICGDEDDNIQFEKIVGHYVYPQKVFIHNDKIVLFDGRSAVIVDANTRKLIREIKPYNQGIKAIYRNNNSLVYHYERDDDWRKGSSLYKLDLDSNQEIILKEEFYESGGNTTTYIEIFNDRLFSFEILDTYDGGSITRIKIKEFDANNFELMNFTSMNFGRNKHSEIPYSFYEGNYYFFMPYYNSIYKNCEEFLKLKSGQDFGNFVVAGGKAIVTAPDKGWNSHLKAGEFMEMDLKTGKPINVIKAHDEEIKVIKRFDDTLVTMTGEGEIKIWELESLELINTIHTPRDIFGRYAGCSVDNNDGKMAVLLDSNVYIYD